MADQKDIDVNCAIARMLGIEPTSVSSIVLTVDLNRSPTAILTDPRSGRETCATFHLSDDGTVYTEETT